VLTAYTERKGENEKTIRISHSGFQSVGLHGGPTQSAYNCGEGICTKLQVVEPVRFNEPITVIITVTTEKDIPGLGVTLSHDAGLEMEGPQTWEKDAKNVALWKGGASWSADAKANQPTRATRKILPPSREGFLQIVASASIPGRGPVATDSVNIYLTREGGKVYLSGTSIPITPGPVPTLAPWMRTPSPTPKQRPYP
jgi:hypothetical protein